MANTTAARKRRSDTLRFSAQRHRKISDASIVRGVEVEVDRTLPFWRCYTDLRLEWKLRPQVLHRASELLCRIPCKVFKQVDVVWARSQVELGRHEEAKAKDSDPTTRRRKATAGAADAISEKGVCVPDSGEEGETIRYTIDTLHFVHADAFRKGLGWENSFHVQSVVLRDAPAVLQCVAGTMVSFAFLIFTALRLVDACAARGCHLNAVVRELQPLWSASLPGPPPSPPAKRMRADGATGQGSSVVQLASSVGEKEEGIRAKEAQLRTWCPPSTARVLILGMGGNSMALALRAVLGPDAVIEVVELEPAVVAACIRVGTLREDDSNMKVHLMDADACLKSLPDGVFHFIFMDIFEPMRATMKNLHPWVATAREKLAAGGLLVLNEHQLPSAEGLAPYGKLFGNRNVQAVNMRGWKESVVVCVAPGDAVTDDNSLEICKQHVDVAFNIYEAFLPGWLPHFSWLQGVRTRTFEKKPFRIWAS